MRILCAEDEPETGRMIREALETCGHEVCVVGDGHRARALGGGGGFDAAVLDRMLPGTDGLSILRAWRSSGFTMPVVLVTALGSVEERIAGLDAGADDYLPKPFHGAELAARVAAVARRDAAATDAVRIRVGGMSLDLARRELDLRGERLSLQPRECAILAQLMRAAGRVVTRAMLIESVWGYGFDPGTNIVESHLCRLRAKISAIAPDPIETLRGLGYRLLAP